MIDMAVVALTIYIGCFILVAVDSTGLGSSPVFLRLVGEPFAVLAYGIARELG